MNDVDWFICSKRWKQIEDFAWRVEKDAIKCLQKKFDDGTLIDADLKRAYTIINGIKRRDTRRRFYEDTGSYDGCPV